MHPALIGVLFVPKSSFLAQVNATFIYAAKKTVQNQLVAEGFW
jgi:hypothetical protein